MENTDCIKTQMIADSVQSWIDYTQAHRAMQGLATTDDTHVITPPIWPDIGTLKEWVKHLRNLAR